MKYILLILTLLMFTHCTRCSNPRPRTKTGTTTETKTNRPSGASGVIQMTPRGGVYEIPAQVNGVEMNFIFDTGASDITISLTEALFLQKQGKLLDKDIGSTVGFTIADGSIAEGTLINLRSVKIGNKELKNVKASIMHNSEAPLLLGQSALSRFGKITIDYKTNQLTIQ